MLSLPSSQFLVGSSASSPAKSESVHCVSFRDMCVSSSTTLSYKMTSSSPCNLMSTLYRMVVKKLSEEEWMKGG